MARPHGAWPLVNFRIEISFSTELHGSSKLLMMSCPPSSGVQSNNAKISDEEKTEMHGLTYRSALDSRDTLTFPTITCKRALKRSNTIISGSEVK